MTYGLVVNNSSNVTIINDTYKNMKLVKKETYNVNAGTVIVINQSPYRNPICAITSNAGSCVIAHDNRSGVSYWYIISTASGSFTAYIFDDIQSGSNYGMQVYSNTSELLFDSSNKYLRVVGNLPVPFDTTYPGTFPTVNQSYSVNTVAIAVGAPRRYYYGGSGGLDYMRFDSIYTSNNSVSIGFAGNIYVGGANPSSPIGSNQWFFLKNGLMGQGGSSALALIIDVTNY